MSQQCLFWLASSACVFLVGARTVTWNTPHGSTVVKYDAGTSGLNVQAHDSVHELPLGRLLQDVDEGTRIITVNPDEFYLAKTDTGVTLYGSEINLADYYGTGLWDPHVALTVYSYKLKLPKHMQFERPLSNREHVVHLHAAVLELHLEGTTINVSGYDADDIYTVATDGAVLGGSGKQGRPGTGGAPGGHVNIEAGTITGQLTVLANGGNGGRGGRGGDGRRGEHGTRASETACCQQNPNLAGSDGQPGGNGGNGGNGGAGAAPGLVQIRFKDGDSAHITVENSTGLGGEGGYSGTAGDGGRGGLGAMVIKKKGVNGICYCKGDPGPSGQDGADGQDGTDGLISSAGADISFLVDQVPSLSEVRKGSCGQHLRYENFYGDQMFIQGNFVLAKNIYSWVSAVLHQECDQGMFAWVAEASRAVTKQIQMNQGRDYYNSRWNQVPQVNIDSLMLEATTLLNLAKNAENSYDHWIAQSTEDMSEMISYSKEINFLDNQVNTNLKNMNSFANTVKYIMADIRVAEEKIAQVEALMHQTEADCQLAVQAAVLSEEYVGANTFERLRDFSKNSMTTSAEQLAQMGTIYQQADGIYASGAALKPAVWSVASPTTVLDYMYTNAGGLGGGSSRGFGLENFLDINPNNMPVQTFIDQVRGFEGYPSERNQDINMRTGVKDRWDELWDYWAKNKASTVQRVLLYQTQATYDKELDDFTEQIPDCAYMKDTFKSYQEANEELSVLLEDHDGTAVSYATRQTNVIKARADRKSLELNRFLDPTSPEIAKIIAESYRSQKDDVIYVLKNMRGLMNYKFCESRPFTYKSMRIAQLENVLATMHEENLEKSTDLSAGFGVLAKNPATIIFRRGPLPEAVVAIDIESSTLGSNWDDFISGGKITFKVDADHSALPRAVSNLHIVDVQAFFPELQGNPGLNQIWVEKTGESKCVDAKGDEFAFTHPPQVYTSISDHSGGGARPKFLSHTMLTGIDSTGPSPLGSWSLQSPVEGRNALNKVTILLTLSYRSLETAPLSGVTLMA